MTVKVAIADVVRDTVKLLVDRKAYALAAFIPLLAFSIATEWILDAEDVSQAVPGGWWSFAVLILLSTIPQAAVQNYYITTLRFGTSSALPGGLLGKAGRVLLKEIQVLAVAFVPGAIVSGVFLGVLAALPPGAVQDADPSFEKWLQLLLNIVIALGFGWPMARLGAGIAGETVGEKVSLKESWRMTKGHSFGLFLFVFALLFVPYLGSKVIMPEKGSYGLLSPELLAQSVLSTFVYFFSLVGFSVWYVRLRERYEAMEPVETAAGDKISPVAVVVDGLNLFCLRYKVYLSFMVLTTLSSLPMLGSGNNPEAFFAGTNLAAFGLSMLVTFFGYLVVFHDSLSFLRGEPRLLPPKFATRFLRLLWKSFLLLLMAMGPLAVTVIVMSIVASLWTGELGEGMAGISFKVAAVLPMAYFGCRWSMALPAVAMGDDSSFRLSWRMTRGHSSLLVLFSLPSIVLVAITQTVNRQDILAGVFDPFSSTNLAFMGAGTVAFWFTLVMFIVWYEKLRLRYEAIRASEQATAAEFEFKEEA